MIKKFTYQGYKNLLEIALKSGYDFIEFNKIKFTKLDKFCVLRHDIDADLNAAHEMALIESRLGIRATYFLMLRSPVYNLLSRSNHRLVNKIVDLGHEIGIHYDEGFYAKNQDLNVLLNEEVLVLQNMFGKKIRTVSFHQPGQKVISNQIKVTNYINTYDKEDLAGVIYISDSNKVWKESTPWDIFAESKYKKLHLLIHPMWWMRDNDLSTEKVWSQTILNHFKREERQICETERAYGKEREMIIRTKN